MSSPTPAVAASSPPSVLSPVVDLLCVGGVSLLVLVPLLASGRDNLDFITLGALAWTQAVLNYAHFMASYRIVYRDREMILRHKWASIGVPLLMLAFLVLAVLEVQAGSRLLLTVFFAVASGYLAWHYTGQVWGMMASYAHLEGVGFDRIERLAIRSGLRILLAWHVVWFLKTALRDAAVVEPLYQVLGAGAVLALALGAFGLWKMSVRTGRRPPGRVLVPWLAIFVWYAALARWGLPALFLVQMFHALQYLEFPVRVEINRAVARTPGRVAARVAGYVAGLLAVTVVVLLVVPGPAMSVVADLLGAGQESVVPILVLYFINIHHYFTDGVIWKISNPEVRRELFAHVAPAAARSTIPAAAEAAVGSRDRRRGRGRR